MPKMKSSRDSEWARKTVGGGSKKNMEDRIRVLDGFHTPKIAVDRLVEEVKLKRRVWECANGHNRISGRLTKKHRRRVFRSDIHRWVPETQKIIDFTDTTFRPFKGKPFDIVTNPPFVRGQEFIETAMQLLPPGGKLCLLLRLQFLEGGKRRILFEKYPPSEVLVFSKRLPRMHRFDFSLKAFKRSVLKSGKKYTEPSSALCFCWIVWEKKSSPLTQAAVETKLRWI